jgi:hypothetical protein
MTWKYKVRKAMSLHGARYLHILVPCPLGWGAASTTPSGWRAGREMRLLPGLRSRARGEVTQVTRIRRQVPVEDYLQPQKRFAHLFHPARDEAHRAHAGHRRPQHPALRPDRGAAMTMRKNPSPSRWTWAVHWPTTPVPGATSARCTSAACRLATSSARQAKTSRPGCSTPKWGLRICLARAGAGQPVSRHHGPGVLPHL